MKELVKRKKLLLDVLSNESVRILEIWHPTRPDEVFFYETGDFRPAAGDVNFHKISRCKDITHIIDQQSSVFANSKDQIRSILTAIENEKLSTVSKEFDKSFIWIWHI